MGDTTGESVTVGFPEAQLPLHIAYCIFDSWCVPLQVIVYNRCARGPAGENGEVMIAMKSLREQNVVMDDYTELTGTIIGAAMEVHNYWGPGLIESIYEKSLQHELALRNVEVRRQVKLQLKYKDLELDHDYEVNRLQSWITD